MVLDGHTLAGDRKGTLDEQGHEPRRGDEQLRVGGKPKVEDVLCDALYQIESEAGVCGHETARADESAEGQPAPTFRILEPPLHHASSK